MAIIKYLIYVYECTKTNQSNKPPISTSSSGSGAFSTGFGASYLAAAGAYAGACAGALDPPWDLTHLNTTQR